MGTPLQDFEAMVNAHDLTYTYSDDGAVYRRGETQLHRIKEAAKNLPLDTVRSVWNAKVDKTLAEGYRKPFYWKS